MNNWDIRVLGGCILPSYYLRNLIFCSFFTICSVAKQQLSGPLPLQLSDIFETEITHKSDQYLKWYISDKFWKGMWSFEIQKSKNMSNCHVRNSSFFVSSSEQKLNFWHLRTEKKAGKLCDVKLLLKKCEKKNGPDFWCNPRVPKVTQPANYLDRYSVWSVHMVPILVAFHLPSRSCGSFFDTSKAQIWKVIKTYILHNF